MRVLRSSYEYDRGWGGSFKGIGEGSAVRYATRSAIVMGQLLFELLLIFDKYCLVFK